MRLHPTLAKVAKEVSYRSVFVKKPWGYEYLMFDNGAIGIWYLHIQPGGRTSMHCHPHKKTGLVLLSGEALVSSLNDSIPLKPLGKVNIRQRLFHSTVALSREGISAIEVESPPDKTNLVRLDDEYGRDEESYEGPTSIFPMDGTCVQLRPPEEGQPRAYSLCGCHLRVERFEDALSLKQRQRISEEVAVVLEGGLFSRSGEPVLSPADVVSSGTLDRLADAFSVPYGVSLLTLRKEG